MRVYAGPEGRIYLRNGRDFYRWVDACGVWTPIGSLGPVWSSTGMVNHEVGLDITPDSGDWYIPDLQDCRLLSIEHPELLAAAARQEDIHNTRRRT